MRALVLFGVVVGALVALLWARPSMVPGGEAPRLTYVTTAHQLGVVGYRDPVGVISPDAMRLAYTEGRHIRVVPIAVGGPRTLPAGEGQIRYLAWADNTTLIAEDTGTSVRWQSYDLAADGGARQPLWGGRDMNYLRQPAWSADGKSVVALATGKEGAELWWISADGATRERTPLSGHPSSPAWTQPAWSPDGARIAFTVWSYEATFERALWGQVKKITVWDCGGLSPIIPNCDFLDLTPTIPILRR